MTALPYTDAPEETHPALSTNVAVATTGNSSSLYSYLGKATKILQKFGIAPLEDETAQLAVMLGDLATVDQGKVVAIGKVLEYQSAVNQFMQEEMQEVEVARRHEKIASKFEGIAGDLRRMIEQLEDGKIDLGERFENLTKRLVSGTVQSQFEDIRDLHRSVTNDTKDHIVRQETIMDAYVNFRGALAQGEVLAYQLRDAQGGLLQQAQSNAVEAQQSLDAFEGADAEKRSLQIKRDEALGAVKDAKSRYDLAHQVAEGLRNGYNIGEAVMAHYGSLHEQTEAIYRKSVIFFKTHETAFTGLEAAVLGQKGLHEMTQAQKAVRKGGESLIEVLAEVGSSVQGTALEETYGPGIAAEPVAKLLEQVVQYQTDVLQKGEELRRQATENTLAIEAEVNSAKQKIIAALNAYNQGEYSSGTQEGA